MTNKTTTRPAFARIALIAGAAGIVAGLAAVYGIGGFSGNGVDNGTCQETHATVRAVTPFRTGQVANFIPSQEPVFVADLSFNDSDGGKKTVADYGGQVILLNLWATWCAPCRKEMPALDRLQENLGGERFSVVAVNIDRRKTARAKAFLTENSITRLGFNADPTTKIFETLKQRGRAFGMPTTMLIDDKGCEIGTLHGAAEWDSDDAAALIKAALDATKK